ncbi:MAG: nucleotidyltransferase domain-containing protein [Gemmatimonadota bacterium]
MSIGERLHDYLMGMDGQGVLAAYLFGPLAGEEAGQADVDVALLLDRPTFPGRSDRGDEAERLSAELIQVLRRESVAVVVLNDLPHTRARELIKRGRRFLVRDDEQVQAFERDVLLRAAEVEGLVERPPSR